MIITAGKTNVSIFVYFAQDDSATSPGEPKTGLLFSDIETGGSGSYVRAGAARVDITLVTLASASAPHSDGGFILVDDTNLPGVYRLDIPDASIVTGVDQVVVGLVAASANNAVMHPVIIDLTDVDFRDAVRGGMTALPNATADAAGGLPISDAGGLDLDALNVNINDIETDTAAMQPLVAKIPLSDGVITWNATALASINAEADTAISDAALATAANLATVDTVVDSILVDTTAILVDTGTTLQAELDAIQAAVITNAAGADIAADIIAMKADTAAILIDTGTTLDAALAVVDANVDAILVDTSTTLQAELDAIQAATITNAAGVDIAADIIALKAETALIVADTGELQTDWVDGGRLDLILDAILLDTGTSIPISITVLDAAISGIDAKLPAALVGGLMSSDVTAISTSTDAADKLEASAEIVITGAATAVTLTTVQMSADGFTEATDDHFVGRVIIWTSGALLGQATDITDYAGASQTFTFTAVTEAPANNDTFVII